ncbi:MAG TPA: zf-HC2 domain-containing protein [Gemmatimonadales bacterium]|nr:zf-HC2 domain-containing protein [Gemmatimonadales bacterium]
MSHLDEGTLHALLDGELELAQVQEIQLHLGTCAACGSRLQDVKQFLAEADRLVGALEIPAGGSRARHESATHREPPPDPAPPPRTFREPEPWVETPPPLLLPDPLDSQERRKRWMRGLTLAAMVGAVLLGGRMLTSALRPSKPELQFTERDLATPAPTAQPAVVSPEERGPAPAPVVRQSRPAPTNREPARKAAPPPAPKVLADQPAPDTGADELDTVLAAAEDSVPVDESVALADNPEEAVAEQPRPNESRDDTDQETRRAAAAALAELDRERLRSRANSATAALPRSETTPAAAPAAPRTLEQRAQVYLRIGLDEAVRQLGRPVHVIEGMSPEFIGLTPGRGVPGADGARPVVRVVYLDRRGRMILLDQQRMRTGQAPGAATGALRWALGDVMLYLHGEAGGDVLRDLQRRVR